MDVRVSLRYSQGQKSAFVITISCFEERRAVVVVEILAVKLLESL